MSGCVREHEENRHSKKRRKQAEVRVGPTVVQEAFNADASVWKPKVTVKHCFCLQIVDIGRADTSEKVRGTRPEIKKNVKKWHTDGRPTDDGGDDKPAPVGIRNRPTSQSAPGVLRVRQARLLSASMRFSHLTETHMRHGACLVTSVGQFLEVERGVGGCMEAAQAAGGYCAPFEIGRRLRDRRGLTGPLPSLRTCVARGLIWAPVQRGTDKRTGLAREPVQPDRSQTSR